MSGAQTSSFLPPNELFNAPAVMQAAQGYRTNELANQATETNLANANAEHISRAANWVLTQPDKAAAYSKALGALQGMGMAKNAPSAYPGDDAIQMYARMGTPSADQWKIQQGQVTGKAIADSLAPTPAAPGPGAAATPPPSLTPFVAQNLPPGVTPAEDQIVRTVIGEAGGEPVAGQQAVAHVIRTRANLGKQDTQSVIFAPKQFEPWNNPETRAKLEAIDPSSPQYQQVLNNVVRPVFAGQTQDPTGGATHFFSPTAQAALGRDAPSWATGNRTTIGRHEFYYPGYAPPQQTAAATPPPAAGAPAAPIAVGDSLAVGVGTAGKMPTFATSGDAPRVVLGKIQALPQEQVAGKDVMLSGGASNAPGDVGVVADQVQALKDKGAKSVTVVGVGNHPSLAGVNDRLQTIAQQTGAQFRQVDPATLTPGGIHPTPAGYAALAAPGAPAAPAPYQVAGPAVAPPGGAPAPGAPAAPPAAPDAAPPAASQMMPAGGGAPVPAPPGAPVLLSNGLQPQQWKLIQAQLADPNFMSKEGASQQLASQVLQMQTTNRAQQQQAWADAHPDLKFEWTSQGLIALNPKTGQIVAASGPSLQQNIQSRGHEGIARWDGSKWVQAKPDDADAVPGSWIVSGTNNIEFLPKAQRSATYSADLMKEDYNRDQKELPDIAQMAQSARSSQIRWQTMLDLVGKLSTGAGGATRAQLANIAETAGWPSIAHTLIAHNSEGDAAAAQEFTKLATQAAGADARNDLGSRAGLGAIRLFQSANPNLDLRPGANKAIIGMQLIAAQADADYNTAKLAHGNEQAANLRKPGGTYLPLTMFDQQWQTQRNPQVYAAAMGALNGQPSDKWAKGLSDAEYQRALEIVSRASPSATVNGKSGWISMQPNSEAPAAPAVGTVKDGYRFNGGKPDDPASWSKVQ